MHSLPISSFEERVNITHVEIAARELLKRRFDKFRPPREAKINKIAAAVSTLVALCIIPATGIAILLSRYMIAGLLGGKTTFTPAEEQGAALAAVGIAIVGIATFIGILYAGWNCR